MMTEFSIMTECHSGKKYHEPMEIADALKFNRMTVRRTLRDLTMKGYTIRVKSSKGYKYNVTNSLFIKYLNDVKTKIERDMPVFKVSIV